MHTFSKTPIIYSNYERDGVVCHSSYNPELDVAMSHFMTYFFLDNLILAHQNTITLAILETPLPIIITNIYGEYKNYKVTIQSLTHVIDIFVEYNGMYIVTYTINKSVLENLGIVL